MRAETIAAAIGLFAVTNIDDLVILALLFGRAAGDRRAERAILAGQLAGFGAIVVLALVATAGATLLPDDAIPYLGLLPLALGVRAAWALRGGEDEEGAPPALGVGAVAALTLANGGDNVGVYVPVFARADAGAVATTIAAFLVLVVAWCWAGRRLARHPPVARLLARWGHVLLPVVLVALGVAILVEGDAGA
ncbi:cadmium resistance transporter [Patulibacter brassicae]|uniref:Cadmium resistance transporter n=1 Tax=Patulibacter brassicae TaxID=1705717 RepID=A0ABU4VK27_9ACTN|nr:cadmium resistance transporter [Patulibacter brassicae]MDX8151697.1 cadmium resistance transporter [Patulibacter brassicae]